MEFTSEEIAAGATIKVVTSNNTAQFAGLFNNLIRTGIFPDACKVAQLVLNEKPKKGSETQTAYRPICLIYVMGKILETAIKSKIEKELEDKEVLHENQFGFRKEK